MTDPLIGQSLPALVLPSSSGEDCKIPEDLLGSFSILFFYPKDQTPGCTKEACSFRDNAENFKAVNAKIYGISTDAIDSHHRFITKHALNFPLLSDSKKQLAKALGVSSFLGMLSRDTFLIDPQGKIAKVWRKVDSNKTAIESLKEIKGAG